MADEAEKFARDAPGVLSARTVSQGEFIHEYRGEVDGVDHEVRLLTLAPEVTTDAVAEAFTRVAGQWHNPSTHPNIVSVHDRGQDPRPWIAVEVPAGKPLDTIQEELSLSQDRTVIEDMAEALRNASLYNTTHLDLQPKHVYVSTDRGEATVQVYEWGLKRACRVAAGQRPVTPFTAPELLDDPGGGTEQTDVYGLGAVAYYALTGKPPVNRGADGLEGTIRDGDMKPPSLNASEIPPKIDDVILTALASRPADRYDSSYTFQTEINNIIPATSSGRSSSDATPKTDVNYTESDPSKVIFQQWAFWTGAAVYSSPAAVNGLIYIGTAGEKDYCLTAEDGTKRWQCETGGVYASPVGSENTIYVGNQAGDVYALSVEDGSERWRFETSGVYSSPSVSGETVYVGSRDSNLYALDRADGTERWHFNANDAVDSSPLVSGGTVYVGSKDSNLYALDATDGTEKWRFTSGDEVFASPAVGRGTVYIASSDGNIYSLSSEDGTEQWRFQTGSSVNSSPTVMNGTVYVGSNDRKVYALDAGTGTEQWRFQTGDKVFSSPTIANGKVCIGSDDNNVYALNAADGTEQWRFQTDGPVWSSPTVVDGTVYVGSADENVYALTEP